VSAFVVEVIRLTAWLALLAAIFVPLERLFAVERQRIFRKQLAVDLGYFFLNGLLPSTIAAVPLAIIAVTAHRFVPWTLLQATASLPFWPKLGISLLLAETGFYWGHRLSHEIPFLWRFHAVHHSAEELDFLSNSRAHPLDIVFTRLCGFVPLYILGLSQGSAAPALIVVIGTIWGFFIHANVRWRFGWLEWLIATPGFHRWHHTNDAFRDRNYAPLLPVLDVVFGTLHLPKTWPTSYGIDGPMAPSLTGQLLQPLVPPARVAEPASGEVAAPR